ncbi:MAG: S9 family peptidase [Phycisphaeraceae bacterium]|nr:S9 family peptidase [Phycisphaeraceae bacterium]
MIESIRRRSVAAYALTAVAACAIGAPKAEKNPVVDTYHGVSVSDDYRWLEDWDDAKVREWSSAQDRVARGFLAKLPNLGAIKARVAQVMSVPTPSFSSLHMTSDGKVLLGMLKQPPKQQAMLVAWDEPAKVLSAEVGTGVGADAVSLARPVVDPNTLDAKALTSIDWYVPSPDGKLVAVSLSEAGTESGDVSVFEIPSGKRVFETVPRVNGGTAGGSLAWAPDSKSFYYSRYPRGTERPPEDMDVYTQVYSHTLGTPTEKDRYETGKEFPRIAEIQLETLHSKSALDGTVLATVQKGDGGEFEFFLRVPDGTWTQFAKYEDRIVQATFGPDDALYLISRKDAPRGKLMRMSVAAPQIEKAALIVPEQKEALISEFDHANNFVVTESLIYTTYQLGGPSEIRVFDHAGKPQTAPTQLPVGSVGGLATAGGDQILFGNTSFTTPPAYFRFGPQKWTFSSPYSSEKLVNWETTKTALASSSPVDFSDYETVRDFATSKDGTKVPINIIRKKGIALDSSHPCVVTGYGGFGVNREPAFSPASIVLLEQGVVLASANLRGGGEFGEEWHKQGMLTKKQNVFDDFLACCEYMIDHKYTTSNRLAIQGGSNGGLLMGAALTQRPDLFRAVVSHVGIYDMLRVELSPNGAFNVTEYGTVKNPEQFKALHAYSPYHNVKDNTAYPAVLFLTGANDPRVDPMQSRKMTARLQAATSSDPAASPILLRTSMDSGHGGGTPLKARIEEVADVDAFLLWALGVQFSPK